MGVKGLGVFVNTHRRKLLKPFSLHNCYVVIDGNNLAYFIYNKFNCAAHCCFGGDYSWYADQVREFFNLLKMCNVKPIVVLDGGSEKIKMHTMLKRMNEKIGSMKKVKLGLENSTMVFPLFMRIVFKQILQELDVAFFQCDYEADREIAALAHKYHCPVISDDNDFYIYGVDYIPLQWLKFHAEPLYPHSRLKLAVKKFTINCKIFTIDNFCTTFRGVDKNTLPLLSILLGNDYVETTIFERFFSQFNMPEGEYSSARQERIAILIDWLRMETSDSALEKILQHVHSIKHKSITDAINVYTSLDVTFEQYLPLAFRNSIINENPGRKKIENQEVNKKFARMFKNHNNEGDNKDSGIAFRVSDNSGDTMDNFNKQSLKFPDWLLERSRRGNVEAFIFDILIFRTYFTRPQVEHEDLTPSHLSSVPIIKIICKLLVGNRYEEISMLAKNDYRIVEQNIQSYSISLSDTKKIVDLEKVPNLSKKIIKSLLLDYMSIPADFCLDLFPESWKLYVCAIIFWLKNNSEPVVRECHLLSICIGMVALSVLYPKVEKLKEKDFFKEPDGLKNPLIKKMESCSMKCGVSKTKNVGNNSKIDDTQLPTQVVPANVFQSDSIGQIISSINVEDCTAVHSNFEKFHKLDENIGSNTFLFSMSDVHIFAQFQSILFHIMFLNSLLEHPFQEPKISSLYSGTFICNLCIYCNRINDWRKSIESLLKDSPKIMNLINTIYSSLEDSAPHLKLQKVDKMKQSEKKKPNSQNRRPEDKDCECYGDKSNPFYLLS